MRLQQLLLVSLLFVSFSARSQDTTINVSSLENYRVITNQLKVWQQDTGRARLKNVSFDLFRTNKLGSVKENNFYKHRWYMFSLYYNGDEAEKTIYFYPGKMVSARLFVYNKERFAWDRIREREAFSAISLSSKIMLVPLKVQKGDTIHILVQPELHYYNWTQWRPTIAAQNAVNDLILQEFIQPNYTYSILTILMAGMMFMLFSYSFLKFYLNRRSEYLYNSLFAFLFLLVFAVLFLNNYYYQAWWHRYSDFFQKWLQVLGYIFELAFISRFLQLRLRRYTLFKILRISVIVMMVYCCILPFIAFSDTLFMFSNLVFRTMSFLLLGVGVYTVIVLHTWNRFLSRYVSMGLFSLIFTSVLILLFNTILKDKQYLLQKIGGWIILYHAGILTNIFFFRLGLGQKERVEELQKLDDIEKLKLENEKKELEKVLAISSSRVDERNRIAKEIHDDIGSGLTSIRLLSEIALVKKDNKGELGKISANANELVNNLNEIIWSINSKNDTIPNLMAYIRSHMVDYLEPYNIKLSINIPPNIPNVEISGENRRNIFMVIKECFTNIIKHANATAVNFTVQIRDQLIFTIKDNGKGFDDGDILPFKNGIRNMKERIELVGGEMDIWGKNGTTITIKIPLNGHANL